jgi:hypothetical protein
LNIAVALDDVGGGDDDAVLRPHDAAGAEAAAGVHAHHTRLGGGHQLYQGCGYRLQHF